ncbi:ADP-ribosylation factor-like protein 6-interacting protein 1 [Plakobranchus ocellatus]|uniref:ADP-ribosylation factor-like protein 6-interacting protein 1 n=1 Tax=Plakobranchus ocellatus TaxID=259542 RepID=A0AAV4D3M5_9GAST|nr:ADP-ribosylation factor-like protein 6-interacting protein 1 [Plakobranchus ocellatus]
MDYHLRKQFPASSDLPNEGRVSENSLLEMKRDLEGWREVLLPLASLLRWDKPFYPAIIAGTISILFLCVWYSSMSAVTTLSLFFLIVGIFDFIVPHLGPAITGIKTWTGVEEEEFSYICEHISDTQQDIMDTWLGLSAMRQKNPKLFFFVTMGFLTCTAWIGNLIDNLFLTYLLVMFLFLLPGIRQNNMANKYLQPVFNILLKLRQDAKNRKKES